MNKVENIENIKRKLIEVFKRNENVEFAYLFGSTIKGKLHPLSDIDIAVYLKDDSLKKIMKLNAEIIDSVGDNVDLLILNRAPYNIRYTVIKEGILIFSRNEKLRVNFESKAMLLGIEEKEAIDAIEKKLIERFLK